MAFLLFDVNETLSDLGPLDAAFAAVGAPASAVPTWFASTLRDGFAATLVGSPVPFAEVASATLATLLPAHGVRAADSEAAVSSVMDAFTALPVHADVAPGLEALHRDGHRLAALTNGSTANAESLLDRAGLLPLVEACLSVEDTDGWKPAGVAYEHAVRRLGVAAGDLTMVAAHPWDLVGARVAGLGTVHVDRSGTGWPDAFDRPDVVVTDLRDLPAALA